jgi:NAD(P)-dependent dehydrogenase (short-subunit alcohol dehydrogenase family)
MSTLESSVVVVTGGATGIGHAIALEAARRGARVFIGDVQDAQPTVEAIAALGAEASWQVCDMTDIAQVRELARAARLRFGEVNVLCNNAGRGAAGALQDTDPAVARQIFELNILGLFHGVHAFAPLLAEAARAGRPAYLLNTGSEHSLGVPPHVGPMSVYTTSKYAVLGLTDTARRDLSPQGIGVSLLTPGWVLTENVRGLIAASPERARAILPHGQEPALVASLAFDGLLAGHAVIATNPSSRGFAMAHARELMADVQRLPLLADGEHAATESGPSGRCPFSRGQ